MSTPDPKLGAERPSSELPRLPRDRQDDYAEAPVAARLELARSVAGRSLRHLAGEQVPAAAARGQVENYVGHAQIPVGLAGPLCVQGEAGSYEVYVPMAATEGAMVASYARGMKLLAAGGAAQARVTSEGLTQCPMLVYERAEEAEAAALIARAAWPELVEIVAGTTRHGALVGFEARPVGRRLVLELCFTTGEALGINMAARATELCAAELARRTGARKHYVHGEDVEKRGNQRALERGRGRSARAEVIVPRAELQRIARTTPEELAAIQRSYALGFARLGTRNGLVQSANGLAAVLLACGQDVAYVAESAVGHLELEPTPAGDLYACAVLPALFVGTVGGGSGQGTAAECLALLGCSGPGSARRLAEILAATVLAGDLSLLASFCTHEFVEAHERLGRNRPTGERAP